MWIFIHLGRVSVRDFVYAFHIAGRERFVNNSCIRDVIVMGYHQRLGWKEVLLEQRAHLHHIEAFKKTFFTKGGRSLIMNLS